MLHVALSLWPKLSHDWFWQRPEEQNGFCSVAVLFVVDIGFWFLLCQWVDSLGIDRNVRRVEGQCSGLDCLGSDVYLECLIMRPTYPGGTLGSSFRPQSFWVCLQ